MRMKYAEMNSPNKEVITARNTHKAMRAGGTPTSPTSPERLLACILDPWRSHDRVLKRLTRINQTITPTVSAPNATQIFMNALCRPSARARPARSEEHTSELQSRLHLVCRLLLEKKKKNKNWRAVCNMTKMVYI